MSTTQSTTALGTRVAVLSLEAVTLAYKGEQLAWEAYRTSSDGNRPAALAAWNAASKTLSAILDADSAVLLHYPY